MAMFRRSRRRYLKRRPIRKRRLIRRKRFIRRRRNNGNFTCKLSNISDATVTASGLTLPLYTQIDQFPEASGLAANFEAYKIHNVRVKIIPKFNVGTAAAGAAQVGPYFSAPWHREVTASNITYDSIRSIDKHRSYHGCSTSVRNFKPSILMAQLVTGGGTTTHLQTTRFSPRIELGSADSGAVRHYCGLYFFAGMESGAGTINYDVLLDMKVTFYNQKLTTLT
ncbi:capsid protein [robinz virus RP_584]|uniref:Capsid protein n=1 Tax=robinz virus RP_584 TaxID=2886400 RepID=A0A8K1PHP3_9CIRC|nr:capsid protein [robinz virus RP_584]UDN67413.1 capsid protein [robinz virus RP_584]